MQAWFDLVRQPVLLTDRATAFGDLYASFNVTRRYGVHCFQQLNATNFL